MDNLVFDFTPIIRGADRLIRQEILYYQQQEKSPDLINYLDLMRPYRYNQKIKRAAFSGDLSN